MKNFLLHAAVAASLVAIPASNVFADGRERVRFAPKTSSIVLKRTLSADVGTGNTTFIVNASKGQLMKFDVQGPKGIYVDLSVPKAHDPELQSESGKSNEYKVVKSGEHYITVVNRTGKKAPFTLTLQILTSAQATAQAQAKALKRIDWMKEGRSLVWEAEVGAKKSRDYVFYARKGQKLTLSFIDDTGVGSMDVGKYSVEPNTDPMEMTIPATKDYTITLVNNSAKTTSFRVGFTLEDAVAPVTERIQFPKNSIEVNLEKSVPAHSAKRFVFAARKGQEIAFTITPKSKDAKLALNFAGKPVATGKLFTMIAPKTGDYQLLVTNSDWSVRGFTFDLGIDYPHKP